MLITFFAALELGIETGVVVGVISSLALYLWRTSRPSVTVVGRVGTTEQYRSVRRHQVHTDPSVIAIRVDESLYFANSKHVADLIRQAVANHQGVKHLVLIGASIDDIDASALETLEGLIEELRDAGVATHLAEMRGPVMDRLERVGFVGHLGEGRVFFSTHEAMQALIPGGEHAATVPVAVSSPQASPLVP
jgi:SulP family sulfate permease